MGLVLTFHSIFSLVLIRLRTALATGWSKWGSARAEGEVVSAHGDFIPWGMSGGEAKASTLMIFL